jgi:hypothetical protein
MEQTTTGTLGPKLMTETKQRPILFSSAMVNAILQGRKTMTRRILGSGHSFGVKIKNGARAWLNLEKCNSDDFKEIITYCPYGKIGDILWVRETWLYWELFKAYVYKADDNDKLFLSFGQTIDNAKWKPSIFMPKDACRIYLRLTDVRIERLQDISEDDAKAEGLSFWQLDKRTGYKDYLAKDIRYFENPIESFKSLWQSIHGNQSWDNNPWVFAIEFERIEKP